MEKNENMVKNISIEIVRNCQAFNVNVEIEFITFIVELMLLNPKYGKMLVGKINRVNLEIFVNDCVAMILSGDLSLATLKMQFIMITNYGELETLSANHARHIETCLRPLVQEIVEADPDEEDEEMEEEFRKLHRKICIYLVLASGLGNPGMLINLKEGMAALESVFAADEVYLWVTFPVPEKEKRLREMLSVVSGVRIFNRDCRKGGDHIQNLALDLVDTAHVCWSLLSNSIFATMQRVNMLTSAVGDCVTIDPETGDVEVTLPPDTELIESQYRDMMELLIFNRQFELYSRRLLYDTECIKRVAETLVEQYETILAKIHETVQYKRAVRCEIVFPLFTELWNIWHTMQEQMYLASTINRLIKLLGSMQEHMKLNFPLLEQMLEGKTITTDQERMTMHIRSSEDLTNLDQLKNLHLRNKDSLLTVKVDKQIEFLGFCAMCLCQGVLVASNLRLGQVRYQGKGYGFCNSKMALYFAKDPQRYINCVLGYARHNIQLINFLDIRSQMEEVKDVEVLCEKSELGMRIKVSDKNIQTELHPVESNVVRNYSLNLWDVKRDACKMATLVNTKTHSTQTDYSHFRSEIQSQTTDLRDKQLQTMKDAGVMTVEMCRGFFWGLRGQIGDGQHMMRLTEGHEGEKLQPESKSVCADEDRVARLRGERVGRRIEENVKRLAQAMAALEMID